MPVSRHPDRSVIFRLNSWNDYDIRNNPYARGSVPTALTYGRDARRSYGDFNGTMGFVAVNKVVFGVKSIAFALRLDALNKDIIDFDGGTHSIEVAANGTLSATGWVSPSIYSNGVGIGSTKLTTYNRILSLQELTQLWSSSKNLMG